MESNKEIIIEDLLRWRQNWKLRGVQLYVLGATALPF
jgi:hypothetical protein